MDARLSQGIKLFNAGRFFESHEILEQFYHETEAAHKPFVEGLIQLAAAFRLYTDFGEVKGPVRMIHQALIRFENYQPFYLEIRVRDLSESMEAWAGKATGAAGGRPLAVPKIRFEGFSFFHERT
jgi:predicted metal-dependent hydrolase